VVLGGVEIVDPCGERGWQPLFALGHSKRRGEAFQFTDAHLHYTSLVQGGQ
jgi:hypothetical protein